VEKEQFMAVRAHTAGVLLEKDGKKEHRKHLDYLNPIFKRFQWWLPVKKLR